MAEWGTAMTNWLRSQENLVGQELEGASLQLAVQRAQELLEGIVGRTRRDLADLGLPYAIHVMGELGQVGGVLKPLADRLEQVGMQCPTHALAVPDSLSTAMRGMGRTRLGEAGSEQLVDRMTAGLAESVFQWLLARTATYLATALRDLAASAVKPLSDALDEARKVLERERRDDHNAFGVADVATDVYQAWPGEPPAGAADGPRCRSGSRRRTTRWSSWASSSTRGASWSTSWPPCPRNRAVTCTGPTPKPCVKS